MGGPIAAQPTDTELARLCAIDGPLGAGVVARPVTRDAMIFKTRQFADAADQAGERSWASMLRQAASSRRSLVMGHALALLARRGPSRIKIDREQLRQLLIDVVATWEPNPGAS